MDCYYRECPFIAEQERFIITIDGELNIDSNNPVKNKVITSKIIDMDSKIASKATQAALTLDSSFDLSVFLKNAEGTTISTDVVHLPLRAMIIGATYANQTLTLTLRNGQILNIPIGDIISGLVPNSRKINGQTLDHDITIQGGEGSVDDDFSYTSENPVQNKVITVKLFDMATKLNGIETGAQANKIEAVVVNGSTASIDPVTKTATVSVGTFVHIPESVTTTGTTLALCQSLLSSVDVTDGMTFGGMVSLTDGPVSGSSYVEIKVVSATSGSEEFQLEMMNPTTNERFWKAVYKGGYMEFGDTSKPWFAALVAPLSNYDESHASHGHALAKEHRAASEQYVDDKIGEIDQVLVALLNEQGT